MPDDRVQRISDLIREGLGYEAGDLTPAAHRALLSVSKELATLQAALLPGVLKNCREMWEASGEHRPLYIKQIPYVYPELARTYRRQQKRLARLEDEARARNAQFTRPAVEDDPEHRARVASRVRASFEQSEELTQ